jgi:glycosyltransferase involved in cell wall biosynthesis
MSARWTVRRWSVKHFWRRMRLPVRRKRWAAELLRTAEPYGKSPNAKLTTGPAVVFGEFSGVHGLGRAATYDVAMLRERHLSLHLVDIRPYLDVEEPPRLDIPAVENVYFFCQPDTFATVLKLLDPAAIAKAYRVGRWVWETPLLPREWAFGQNIVHEVWAPSAYCAEVFAAALDVPVTIIEHAVVPPPDPHIDMRARLSIPAAAFVGLSVMDIKSCPARKNPWAHIRAWRDAFHGSCDAVLVMKVRVGKRTRIVLDELEELIGDDNNIILLTEDLDNDEIAALFRSADVFLSLHRSEGFGLNILEALLLGKDVVATNWSANAEYGPRFPHYHGIKYKLVPYQDWTAHYQDKNFAWADPDHGAAVDALTTRFKDRKRSTVAPVLMDACD